MFRFTLVATAVLLSTSQVLANGHGGGDAPPPPKPDAMTSPARAVQTKQGPRLVDLKGMTLYFYAQDTSGKTSSCDGKCAEAWIPLAASADAKPMGDFTTITRSDGSKMW